MKAFCIWCEYGNNLSSTGYFWIHPDCFNKIMDISDGVSSIKEILEGTHSRNKLEKEGQSKIDIIHDFIKDMEKFEKQWKGSVKLYKELSQKGGKKK